MNEEKKADVNVVKKSVKKSVKKAVINKSSPKKLNAAQKLEALENMVMGLQNQINIVAEEIDNVGQIVQLLGRKLNASNKVANIADESVNQVIIKENTLQLENLVKELRDKGVIKESESGEIADEQHFVVAREIDKDGNVIAPRIQFAVMTLIPELKPQFIGQKKGSIIKNEQNENSLEITEVYSVIPPKKEINFEKEADVSEGEPTA